MDDCTIPRKCCTKCGEEKPDTEQFFSRREKGKLRKDCRECQHKRRVAYYYANQEAAITYSKEWVAANAEHVREMGKRWREENPERKKQNDREYYVQNREKIVQRVREWRLAGKRDQNAEARKYRAKYPEKAKTAVQRRLARKRNAQGQFTAGDWKVALNYFNGCCAVCGNPLRDLFGSTTAAMDHWIPLSRGGNHDRLNIVPLCHGTGGCNTRKNAKEPNVWLIETFGKRRAAEILKRIEAYFVWLSLP